MSFDYFGDGWRPTFSTRTINGTWVSGLVFAGPLVEGIRRFYEGEGEEDEGARRRKIRVDRGERVKEGERERGEILARCHARYKGLLSRAWSYCVCSGEVPKAGAPALMLPSLPPTL